jgi:hypothetical protein
MATFRRLYMKLYDFYTEVSRCPVGGSWTWLWRWLSMAARRGLLESETRSASNLADTWSSLQQSKRTSVNLSFKVGADLNTLEILLKYACNAVMLLL